MKRLYIIMTFLLLGLVFTGCNNQGKDISNDYHTNENESPKDTIDKDTIYDEGYNSNGITPSGSVDQTLVIDNDNSDKSADVDTDYSDIDTDLSSIYYYVSDNGVRMREDATLESEILLQLVKGNKVEYMDRKGEWLKVRYNNEIGYIRSDLLSDTEPIEQSVDEALEEANVPSETRSNAIETIDSPKIIVKKADRIIQLWDGDNLWNSFPIGLGWEPVGDKQREGDGRTPEGIYYVCTRNRYSRFYLSLGISYPNISDAKEALEVGLIDQSTYNQINDAISSGAQPPWNTPMGGEIMIHGHGSHNDWTAGCIAVEDNIMDILWDNCPIGTPVIIEP